MAQANQNVPVNRERQSQRPAASSGDLWRPLTSLRQQIDHLFEDFDRISPFWPMGRSAFGSLMEPFGRAGREMASMPAVDIVDQDKAILISAELPGMDEQNIELKVCNGNLMLKGEKREEREENSQGLYLSERSYGAFQRSFALPDSVDADNIEAHFDKGVLTITLPKRPEAQQSERAIEIRRGEAAAQQQDTTQATTH
ncbi:heat shock Hsp20 protein [Azotobacter vinelandii CA]|uniref:Heat shock Hsp20 protein n=2 Tax=Azotobacter vinelandii TaxID=354 RepID=C1DIS6_AZOVD|nr:Hsp20/alpha crystallin family protein [Azotobacter vinelandii]ACO78757.1 heat shock Hsp20 protein [Azotobacter vinelandii DJ]AGK14916.1 heat shock Hsp20 protein [Azotobacter vinelandii CA]AGK20722.1 heat shock Hsp20 protein [Azotobacter vinelandii CA6]SFX33121.1 HSP20 family protein [Azotobacter vinelandii]GLK60132.1 molecular chaperone Hsp20 [Azotobacter vinelandii]